MGGLEGMVDRVDSEGDWGAGAWDFSGQWNNSYGNLSELLVCKGKVRWQAGDCDDPRTEADETDDRGKGNAELCRPMHRRN